MKAEFDLYKNGITINITPETMEDASLLCRIKMNASQNTNEVLSVFCRETGGIKGAVYLKVSNDRAYSCRGMEGSIKRIA